MTAQHKIKKRKAIKIIELKPIPTLLEMIKTLTIFSVNVKLFFCMLLYTID